MIIDDYGRRLFYLDFGEGSWGSKVKDVSVKDTSFPVTTNMNNMNLNLHPAGGIAAYYTETVFENNLIIIPANPTWSDFSFPAAANLWSFGEPHISTSPSVTTPDYILLSPDCYSLSLWGNQGKHSKEEYDYITNHTKPYLHNVLFPYDNSFNFSYSPNYKTKEKGVRYSVWDPYIKKVELNDYNRSSTYFDNVQDGFLNFRTTSDNSTLTAYVFDQSKNNNDIVITQWAILACHNCQPYDIANIYLYDVDVNNKTFSNAFPNVAGNRVKWGGGGANVSWQKGQFMYPMEGLSNAYAEYKGRYYPQYTTTRVVNLNRPWFDGVRTYDMYLIETRQIVMMIGGTLTTPRGEKLHWNGVSSPLYMTTINDSSQESAARVISEYVEFNDYTFLYNNEYSQTQLFYYYKPEVRKGSIIYKWKKMNGV